MARRVLITSLIGGIAIIWPLAIHGQQSPPAPLKRIGILSQYVCGPDSPI